MTFPEANVDITELAGFTAYKQKSSSRGAVMQDNALYAISRFMLA